MYRTVGEVMEKLATYPSDMLILTDGYESGADYIDDILLISVRENTNHREYEGRFNQTKTGKLAVVISRPEHSPYFYYKNPFSL